MKKSLIALAALAAVSAASAQSTVTISGSFSGGVSSVAKANSIAGVDASNSNLVAFTAVEDLGGGLKATGHMGMRFDINRATNETATSTSTVYAANSGIKASGDVYVQLAGAFGEVRAGTFTAHTNGAYNPFNTWTTSRVDDSFTFASSNQVRYTTPTIAGFAAAVSVYTAYAGDTTGAGVVGGATGNLIKLTYANGPLGLGYIKQVTSAIASTTLTTGIEHATLGGTYDFGVAKLFAMTYTNKTAAGVQDDSGNSISIAVPVGAATFKAGRVDRKPVAASTTILDRTSVGVDYALSKRSTLIANMSSNKDHSSSVVSSTNYFLGMSHTF